MMERGIRVRKGFTLFEMIICMTAFGLLIIPIMDFFQSATEHWTRQKEYVECTDNTRLAMEFMTNELRTAHPATLQDVSPVGAIPNNQLLYFENDPTGAGGAVMQKVFYWRGDGAVYGATNALFRGLAPVNGYSAAGLAEANAVRQEMGDFVSAVNFAVANPGAADASCTMTLTFRPHPELAVKKGNRDSILRTRVRPRS